MFELKKDVFIGIISYLIVWNIFCVNNSVPAWLIILAVLYIVDL